MTMTGRLVDTRPLRSSRAFRRLWIGTTSSAFGGQLTTVAGSSRCGSSLTARPGSAPSVLPKRCRWSSLVSSVVRSPVLGTAGGSFRLSQDQVAAGIALTHLGFQASMLIGPAVAGLLIAGWGLPACYLVDAVTFCVALCGS